MEKFRKILVFYILGTVLTFWILAVIRLNAWFFYGYFGYWRWLYILGTALIIGPPIGAAIWVFLTNKFPTTSLDFKFILTFLKPYFYDYLIGILIALVIIAGTELYKYFSGDYYYYANTYLNFRFSVFLGIPVAIGFHTIKTLKL